MNSEIYFHVGVERTGTKFVQAKVFPFFKDIHFINKNRFSIYDKIINKKKEAKYLVSFELNLSPQFENEVKRFSKLYPDTKVVMVMRRQHGWIASHYKRVVKNGKNYTFKQFLDIENGDSVYSQDDLLYYNKLMILKKYFHQRPLVLFYSDLREDPIGYIDKIAKYMGVNYNVNDIDLTPEHASYSLKQLKAIQKVRKHINIERKKVSKNKIINFGYRLYIDAIRYSVIYTTKILPNSWFNTEPLIDNESIQNVKDYYTPDWEKSVKYVIDNKLNVV